MNNNNTNESNPHCESKFEQYKRIQVAELRPYVEGEILSDRVSISAADKENGSPKKGDMIARNPKNHEDQWLIANDYFIENFQQSITPPHESSLQAVDKIIEENPEMVDRLIEKHFKQSPQGKVGTELTQREIEIIEEAYLSTPIKEGNLKALINVFNAGKLAATTPPQETGDKELKFQLNEAYERISNCRHYLMSTENVTVEDALVALGYNKNGFENGK